MPNLPTLLAKGDEIVHTFDEFSISQSGLIRVGIIVAVFVVVSLVLKRVLKAVAERMTKARPVTASTLISVAEGIHLLIFAATVRLLVPMATVDPTDAKKIIYLSHFHIGLGSWASFFDKTANVIVVLAFSHAAYHLVRVPVAWFHRYAQKTPSKLDDMLTPIIDTGLKVFVVLGTIVQLAATLSGNTPTQILAPLAVGGLAVGLAAQDTVKNFFGSMMLILDKPFTLGDTVDIGSHLGTIESLGLRSTRIRTPEGHLVSVPNGDLANRAIRNISERRFIFQKFAVTATYDSGPEKLEKGVEIIRELLNNHEGMKPAFPPRVHLEQLADWSVNIQVIYWYHPADWWMFMKFHQSLLVAIMTRFEAAGIGIAFPTQTVISTPAAPAPGATPANPAGPK